MNRIDRIRECLEWQENLTPYLQNLTKEITEDYRKEIAEYDLRQTTTIYGCAEAREGGGNQPQQSQPADASATDRFTTTTIQPKHISDKGFAYA